MDSLIVAAILLLVSLVVILLSFLLCRLLIVWRATNTLGLFGQQDEEQAVLTKSDQQHPGYKTEVRSLSASHPPRPVPSFAKVKPAQDVLSS